ncbi:hypothetical protein ACLMJK_001733 [Lecanora helva]
MTRVFPPDVLMLKTLAKQVEVATQITYVLVLTVARASILSLYRRIFTLRSTWFRILWSGSAFLIVSFCIVLMSTLAFECAPKPLATLWNSPSSCNPNHDDGVIIGFINALIDLLILILPVRMVWTLQMPVKRRLAVCGIFALGLTGVAVSTARAVAILKGNVGNGTPAGAVSFAIWSTTEAAVALLCACLPLLRPIVNKFYQVLSTHRSNTITTFGFQESQSKASQDILLARSRGFQEDRISLSPVSPDASQGQKIGRISVRAHSVGGSKTKEEV